jgi:tripartite-type tricarboxylate transporter receptor subunit TctC
MKGDLMLTRRCFVTSISTIPLLRPAYGADWPPKAVKIIFPYAPGSSGDAMARLLAQRLSEVFERPFIVENRVGANGVIGADAVARSPADGATLLWAITPQIAISPAMAKVPYDPVRDFAPVSAVCTNSFALLVNPTLPVRTVAEFVEYVRARSGRLAYAEGGVGSIGHLAMALFLQRAGLSMTNVTYKGNQPALTDVIAGHVPCMFSLLGDALPQHQNGTIRLIAVGSDLRSPKIPDVPTIGESGFPGFKAVSWYGLMAPANTPKSIVDRLASATAHAVRDPKFVESLSVYTVEPLGNSPQQFAGLIAADIAFWNEAVKVAGLELR